ncbi:MAG TPA: glycosyltransferase family 2 protein [Elusimicrobiota bacterium]|nr:glycosyltransferase family 2 protein [Elusimicrobiota bacterium]
MTIDISVVINNYNYGRYLPEAIESVLAQEFPAERMEVIVVDDGSTDDSRERAIAYGSRIIYHRQENRGQAGALNAGFGLARGAYVALLDADDAWRPGKLRAVAGRFAANPRAGLVQHWMRTIDAAGREMPTYVERWPRSYALSDLESGRARFVGTSGLVFRKDALKNILPIPEDLRFCADEYLYTQVLFEADAENISEMLGLRRVHGKNSYAGTMLKPEALERRIRVRQALDRHLEERCRARSMRVPESLRLSSKRERLLCEFFRRRLLGEWREAWSARRALLDSYPSGGYRLFKSLTLLVACISPAAYALLFSFYQRLSTARNSGR